MRKCGLIGLILGALVGFATSSTAAVMMGIGFGLWQRLPPTSQELYVDGMLDAMGYYRVMHPLHSYRALIRSEDCIRRTGASPRQLAQGVAEYAKLNPAAFNFALTPAIGLDVYMEFLCPDLFNQTAYERDDAVMAKYLIDPKDER
jgi:hypothetical protein